MQKVVTRGWGKINLALNVGQVREDGYHEVEMIMQQVSLYDEVTLTMRADNEVRSSSNLGFLVTDERNIAVKAARLMQECYGVGGVDIRLEKHIPVSAGMAGGSADAAAVLDGMSRLFGLDLCQARLMKLGARLGSDIPFCLMGGTGLAQGRGEIVTPLPSLPRTHVVLVKPNFSISTPWSYSHYQADKNNPPADIEAMKRCLSRGEVEGVAKGMRNQLEKTALSVRPVIGRIRQDMMSLGAAGARMTGSGPTVFGLFSASSGGSEEEAHEAAKAAAGELMKKYPRYEVILCETRDAQKAV